MNIAITSKTTQIVFFRGRLPQGFSLPRSAVPTTSDRGFSLHTRSQPPASGSAFLRRSHFLLGRWLMLTRLPALLPGERFAARYRFPRTRPATAEDSFRSALAGRRSPSSSFSLTSISPERRSETIEKEKITKSANLSDSSGRAELVYRDSRHISAEQLLPCDARNVVLVRCAVSCCGL